MKEMVRDSLWRRKILARDGYHCQCCPKETVNAEHDLEAHHVESFETSPRLRHKLFNGVALCKFHHAEFHRRYGKDRNTRSQFREFKMDCLNG